MVYEGQSVARMGRRKKLAKAAKTRAEFDAMFARHRAQIAAMEGGMEEGMEMAIGGSAVKSSKSWYSLVSGSHAVHTRLSPYSHLFFSFSSPLLPPSIPLSLSLSLNFSSNFT